MRRGFARMSSLRPNSGKGLLGTHFLAWVPAVVVLIVLRVLEEMMTLERCQHVGIRRAGNHHQ